MEGEVLHQEASSALAQPAEDDAAAVESSTEPAFFPHPLQDRAASRTNAIVQHVLSGGGDDAGGAGSLSGAGVVGGDIRVVAVPKKSSSADASLANAAKKNKVKFILEVEPFEFDANLLARYIYGQYYPVRQQVLDHLKDHPLFPFEFQLTKEQHRARTLKQVKYLVEKNILSLNLLRDEPLAYIAVGDAINYYDTSLNIKAGVHFGLFGGCLMNLGSERHIQKYWDVTNDFTMPGCFAMTELGHGSNVQGLGTTAVYDKATQEFVINTPRRTDRKWWIGNSQNAKNAVVFAQLWTEGKCHGVHAFIVNLRPKDSDATNPGITIGDCGDKMGLNGVDNGWMEFKDVRVPRANLLNKFGDVKPDGTYITPIKSDMKRFGLQLAALTLGRISLTAGSNNMLKTALTIAIRYSATRKQFGPPGKPEQSILEFTSQQRRLMPRLANCYANIFVCQYTTKLYSEADRSDKKVIQEIHSLSAGTKALASWATQEAIQVCRECCGGQGYAAYNRFAALKNDHDIFQTFEGDNTVLMQQVAKDLVTQFQKQFIGNEFTGAFKYLTKQMRLVFMQRNPVTTYLTSWKHLMRQDFQLQAFEFRAARLLQAGAFRLRNKLAKANGDMFTAWNQCLPELLHLAKAHVERVVLKKFIKAVKDCPDPETQKVLKLLCDLYALTRIEEDIGVFRNHEYIKTNKANAISKLITALCQELSKHAVALVDAFEIPDHLLLAPLALKEGDPLENTLAFVEQRYETYPKL